MTERLTGRLFSKADAYLFFFPLASLYGMLIVPASVYSMLSGHPLLPGIATPLGHAHELLFGYTLAVATGYLLNKVPLWWIVALITAWILARLTFVTLPGSLVADTSNIIFLAGFALAGSSRFLPVARKWRNKMFGVNILLLALAGLGAHMMIDGLPQPGLYTVTYAGVLMISLLMLMMGGRMIAPAVAGHIENQGGVLEARVQPRIEAALILILLAATAAYLLPVPRSVPGLLLVATGLLVLTRLIRWKLWACLDRRDLLSLALGYTWIAVGLLLMGTSMVTGQSTSSAVHAITVGAIGTLTLTVMSKTWLQRSGLKPQDATTLPWIVLLISTAAISRILSSSVNPELVVFVHGGAVTAWVLAFLLVASLFWQYPGRKLRRS